MSPVILLGLNEINFELLGEYARDGTLPTFSALLDSHDLVTTVAEERPEQLEPWIQWVTVHTGLSFAEHQIFRLGDVMHSGHRQIWEILEERFSLRVGAISPMNAENRLRRPAFFMPDPWTKTKTSGALDLRILTPAIVQAVNDNAHHRVSLGSKIALAVSLAWNARPHNYRRYAHLLATAARAKWRRALFLDLLLSDVFIRNVRRSQAEFASLFLNAGAHVQHNYFFSSKHYSGNLKNPHWYLPPGKDPIAEAYQLYDHILGGIRSAFPTARILLCTGLSQKPNPRMMSFYRPKEHAQLLRTLGINTFLSVEPRMSRDFLVTFASDNDAAAAADILASSVSSDGKRVFSVDNRGTSLFCMLIYTDLMGNDFEVRNRLTTVRGFDTLVSHINIENGIHRRDGYFLDTGTVRTGKNVCIPLSDVFYRMVDIFSLPASCHATSAPGIQYSTTGERPDIRLAEATTSFTYPEGPEP